MFSFVILTLTSVIIFVYWKALFRIGKIIACAMKLQGPRPLPLLGNILTMAVPQKDMMSTLVNVLNKYKSPVRLWLGPMLYVFLDDPEDIKTVIKSQSAVNKGDPYDIIRECIGDGLIQANGPKHKVHRKLISPFLHPNYVQSWLGKMDQIFKICSENLEENVAKGPFDIFNYTKYASVDMVSDVLFGYPLNVQRNHNMELIEAIDGIYNQLSERLYRIWLQPRWIYRLTKNYPHTKHCLKYFGKWITEVVDHHNAKTSTEVANGGYSDDTSLLSYVLNKPDDNGQYLSPKEIHEEVCLLFSAAEDTVATVTAFVFLMLAMNQDIQEKVWLEQEQIFGSNIETNTSPQHLSQMVYLNMVIKEVLRMFPIAPLMVRKLNKDLVIGGHNIPEGVNVVINAYKTHMDPKIWPSPEKFDPERFNDENSIKRHQYAFIPFSGGPRSCIGKQFAYTAMDCLISNIIRKYTFHTQWKMEDLELTNDISIRSINGYMVQIKKRFSN